MNYFGTGLAVAVVLVIAGLLVFLLTDSPAPEPEPVASRPVQVPVITPAPQTPPPPPAPVEAPVADIPEIPAQVTESPPLPEPVQLPALNDSDSFVRLQIAGLDAGPVVLAQLSDSEMVRKFVMTAETVSRGFYPTQNLPVLGLNRGIALQETGEDRYLMLPATHDRYNTLVDALVKVDTRQAVQLYRDLEPLVTRAFAELGLPNRNFGDVLLQALDNVINARSFEGPFELVRPNVIYRFADPEIENLSEVEKLLLRMGPANAGRLKQKMQEFRQQLRAEE